MSHDRYTAHVQPAVAVNPRNPHQLLGTALLFRSQHGPYVGTFASFDGGQNWQDNGPLSLPAGADYSDVPAVAFDANGRGFVVALAGKSSDRDEGSDQHTCVCLWRTDNGGRNFSSPVVIVRGQAVDRPSLATEPAERRSQSTVYVVWRSKRPDGIAFSRSVDGGSNFSAPRIVARVPGGGAFVPTIAAAPRGLIYVVYDGLPNQSGGRGAGAKQEPARGNVSDAHVDVVTSADGGRHFGSSVTLGTAPERLIPTRHLDLFSGPRVAVDPRDGSAYVTYAAVGPRRTQADILLRRSRDGGRTWRSALRIRAQGQPSAGVSFQPEVVVDDAGGVDVSFFVLARGRVDVWLVRSLTHGVTFGRAQRITSQSFNPALGMPVGSSKNPVWWIGDYQGLAAGGGMIHPCWNDTRTGRLEIDTAAVPERLRLAP